MTLKTEIAIVALTLAGAAAYVYTQDVFAVQTPVAAERTSTFTQADFTAFDRGFDVDGTVCAVGIAAQDYCFTPSPLEDRLQSGSVLDASIPVLSARYRVLAQLAPKVETLKTAQYGQTLVLIEPDTRMVRDVLILDAASFAEARPPVLTASAGTEDAALQK